MSVIINKWISGQIAEAIGAHEIYVSHRVLVFNDKRTAVEVTYRRDHPAYVGGVWIEVYDTEELIGGGVAEPISGTVVS